MRRISSYMEFEVGKVYNRVYVGENEAYAKVNGKITFIVTEVDPILTVDELFGQFGNPLTDDIRRSGIFFKCPKIALADFELSEPTNKSEWFIKSEKKGSVDEIIRAGIPRDLLCNTRIASGRFVPCFGRGSEMRGVYRHFSLEGRVDNPYLQSVFGVWRNWEELHRDFRNHGTKII